MIDITIHGCRGSVPVSSANHVRHGGATTCVEIVVDANVRPILLDCGTGLADAGRTWANRNSALVLQSHFHWDHIQGLPFFSPIYRPDQQLEFWAVTRDGNCLQDVLRDQMRRPNFPVTLDDLPSRLTFRNIVKEGTHELAPGVVLRWAEMMHPSGSTAFRIDHEGSSAVFSGDVEVRHGSWEALVDLARGADLLVMDAQYFPEEYTQREGFGHSSCLDAVDVAVEAGVKQLLMTHHDPGHDDRKLDEKLAMARKHAPSGLVVGNAWDGLRVRLASGSQDSEPARI